MATTIQQMLHEFLAALGFAAMARDVLSEREPARLRQYARVVLKQTPEPKRREIHSRFAMLRLV